MRTKLFLVVLIIILVSAFYLSRAHHHLELNSIQEELSSIKKVYQSSPLKVFLAFVGLFVFMTGLSIPGTIVLTLVSGAIFGVWQGTLIVTLCCVVGASLSFLTSRYLFKESVERKFNRQLKVINNKLFHQGNYYFLTIRMMPASPFVVINLVMGLTKMKLLTFSWMTFIGMLPGNLIYVYAGRRISDIDSPKEILTWPVIITLSIVGLLPLLVKRISSNLQRKVEA